MKILALLLLALCIQCTVPKNKIWSDYSIRYVGSGKERDKVISELQKKGYIYEVFSYQDSVYEIRYTIEK